MALIKCPECGREKVSDTAEACPDCGYGIRAHFEKVRQAEEQNIKEERYKKEEENKNQSELNSTEMTELSPKLMLGILGAFLVIIIIVVAVQISNENKKQKGIANQAIIYYNAGKYDKALDVKIDLDKDTLLGDYNEKITLMGNIQKYLNDEDTQLSAVFYYLGNYKVFESEGLIDSVYPKIKDATQKVANSNADFIYNVEYYADKRYEQYTSFDTTKEKKLNQLLEPLLTEDRELMFEIANQINSEIDYELAAREYEKYKQELIEQKQREYDMEHPVQVTNDDCKITHSRGYYYCNGTVHNVSGSTHYYVKVKVTYYDKDDKVLTTDWTYAVSSEGIKGGENQQFEIMTKVDGSPEKFKVEILEYD